MCPRISIYEGRRDTVGQSRKISLAHMSDVKARVAIGMFGGMQIFIIVPGTQNDIVIPTPLGSPVQSRTRCEARRRT